MSVGDCVLDNVGGVIIVIDKLEEFPRPQAFFALTLRVPGMAFIVISGVEVSTIVKFGRVQTYFSTLFNGIMLYTLSVELAQILVEPEIMLALRGIGFTFRTILTGVVVQPFGVI